MKRRKFFNQALLGLLAGASTNMVTSCSKNNHKDDNLKSQILKTPICDLLHITYPIIQAGMADVAGPELVAAVSNAGGLGILTATMVPPDILKQRIQKVRELTDKPFGVNLILHNDIFPLLNLRLMILLLNRFNPHSTDLEKNLTSQYLTLNQINCHH